MTIQKANSHKKRKGIPSIEMLKQIKPEIYPDMIPLQIPLKKTGRRGYLQSFKLRCKTNLLMMWFSCLYHSIDNPYDNAN